MIRCEACGCAIASISYAVIVRGKPYHSACKPIKVAR